MSEPGPDVWRTSACAGYTVTDSTTNGIGTLDLNHNGANVYRFGPVGKAGGKFFYCIEPGVDIPTGAEQIIALTDIPAPNVTAPAGLAVTVPQLAYLMDKYGDESTADTMTRAAMMYIVDSNYRSLSTNLVAALKF